jgi:hypothetical protein
VLDPMTTYYIRLEAKNKDAVAFLNSLGCKGDLLKSELPRKYVVDCSVDTDADERVSVPLVEQTILALMRAKNIGDSYNALTDGKAGHLTSDERIIAAERIVLAKYIKDVEDEKVLRLQSTDRSDAAVAVLAKQKADTALKVTELDTLLKWKLGKPFHKTGMLKATKLKKWLDVKKPPEATVLSAWSTADEEALESMKRRIITINDTALQQKVEETYIEHQSSITHYSLEHLQALRQRLDEVQDRKEAEALAAAGATPAGLTVNPDES